MRTLRQIMALLEMNLGGTKARLGTLLVVIVGTACVVGVLISMLSLGASARGQATQNARDDRAVVAPGADRGGGTLSRDVVLKLGSLPGVKHGPDGKPLVAGAMWVSSEGRKRLDDVRVMYGVAGVQPQFFQLTPEVRLTDGRLFQSGVHEVIVGRTRYATMKGLELGDHVRLRGSDWLVVGHFDVGGFLGDAVLADADTLMSAFNMNAFQNATVMLESARDFQRFKDAAKTDPTINVDIKVETKFAADQAKEFTKLVDFISYFIGVVMAIGATVGSVNAMYVIVDQRRREMATLRAIGFRSFAIVVAVLLESILMALPGAVLGAAVAWILFNGHHVTPFGMSIDLKVTMSVVLLGVGWALTMGLIGGLSPAIRAARTPVAEALRAT